MFTVGSEFTTKKCGDLVVTGRDGYSINVRFIDTGFECTVQQTQLKNGNVKDKLMPSLFGIGFIGDGIYKGYENKKQTSQYLVWHGMLRRCYDQKYHAIFPSYIDCEVCEEWQDFQCFCDWFSCNYPLSGGRWELDKDIKIKGNKIYSPATCKFVRSQENNEAARSKNYVFINPDGFKVEIYNLSKFSRDNGLNSQNMHKLISGEYKTHKGWTFNPSLTKDCKND